jgi:hypothetical protein
VLVIEILRYKQPEIAALFEGLWGPFEIVVPVEASYEELERLMQERPRPGRAGDV